MANNYVPNSDLAFIIGDGGISRASPAPTKVGGDKVNACLEIQSTTRTDIFLSPKTDIQIAAINNPTKGMIAFSSNSNALVVNDGTTWNALTPPGPPPTPPAVLYSETIVTHAQLVTTVFQYLPVNVLPAPGAGLYYNIIGFSVIASSGSSVINMNSERFLLIYNNGSFSDEAAIMDNDVLETSGALAKVDYAPTAMIDTISGNSLAVSGLDNSPMAIWIAGNTASITGGSTYLSIRLWYSIVPSTF